MKIYIFGSSLVSAYWNGAATYYRGIVRGLDALGHEVHFCEPDIFDRQRHRDLAREPDWVRVRVYGDDGELRELQAEAERADLVVKCSGVGARDRELEAWAASLGNRPRTAFWDVDAAYTLDRLEGDADDPLRARIPAFDLVFTYGGGPPVVERYRALGARRCVPIYNGLDPDVHRPVRPDPELACDLVFMGNRLPDRETRVERLFLAVAERHPDRTFLLGGNGWETKRLPDNVRRLGHVPTGRHNALNCSARLVLNVHRTAMAANGYSPATRMFEAAGAGACQITDAWEGIERFFEPGEEVLVARGGAEVGELLEAVDAERAAAIGRAARARALRDHTYGRRARQVHETLRGLPAALAGGVRRRRDGREPGGRGRAGAP
ncbi:MAG: CgeB family protein [Gemmatimonadota bacterium]